MTVLLARRLGAVLVSAWMLAPVAGPGIAYAGERSDAASPLPAARRDAPSAPARAGKANEAPAVADAAPTLHHGSRSKAPDGTVLVYDGVLHVHRCLPNLEQYWDGKQFLRREEGVWMAAPRSSGPWSMVPSSAVPDLLRGTTREPAASSTARLPGGLEAVYDPKVKAYKVAGHKGVFLHEGTFLRVESGLWMKATSVDGPWTAASPSTLPPPLRRAVPLPEDGATASLPTGESLVYEAGTRMFVMSNKPGTVLFDGVFYEKRGDEWFASPGSSAAFAAKDPSTVPGPVRAKLRSGEGTGKKKDKAAAGKAAKGDGKAKPGKAGKGGKPGKGAKDAQAAKAAKAAKAGESGAGAGDGNGDGDGNGEGDGQAAKPGRTTHEADHGKRGHHQGTGVDGDRPAKPGAGHQARGTATKGTPAEDDEAE